MVRGDAAEAVAQPADHVAIEKRPRRIPMQEQQRRTAALVDVVHADSLDVRVVGLEWADLLQIGHATTTNGRAGIRRTRKDGYSGVVYACEIPPSTMKLV